MLTSLAVTGALLSAWVTQPTPWLKQEANSEQRQPVYLGASPRQLSLGLDRPHRGDPVPSGLKTLGEKQLETLSRKLKLKDFEVEAWPARTDQGQLTWTYARYRPSAQGDWSWLELKVAGAFLPVSYRPSVASERSEIFDDFLLLDDLYAKRTFEDCVWTDESGRIFSAWETTPRELSAYDHQICRVIPQPARVDGRARSFVLGVQNGQVLWPVSIVWQGELPPSTIARSPGREPGFAPDFATAFREDVLSCSGENEAQFPLSGKAIRFVRKSSADPQNQIGELVEWLEERYQQLGIPTRRETFAWRGIPQSNLIAVIRGSDPDASQRPLLMADHIDTAFREDEFARSHQRVSAPGADDNCTAVAALLRAATTLAASAPKKDIWLVHLTGEEFPGDDLGARRFVEGLLESKRDIGGLVLLDMVGHHKAGDGLFQISAGDSPESLKMAQVALGFANRMPSEFLGIVRERFDPKSYLYNTDGLVFSDSGYPVILINEHLNALENLNRKGYHDSRDVSALVDWDYAVPIVKTAIQALSALANE